MKADIKSLNLKELTAFVESLGEKAFRAKQIYQWLHVKQVTSFEEMTNISKSFIEKLNENAVLVTLKKEEVQESKIDGTRKYLFCLEDGNVIESVLMRYKHGNSVCISSQVGCRMGCRFCASTLDGLVRNLTPSEMLEQIYRIGTDIGERISNVVVMGTGEPMDNYDNLLKFIELLTDENGLHISQRNLTVSTCGIVPKMRELADADLQITLALSLHASTQAKRLELMPVANKYEIHEVVDACRYYFEKTGRRVTFEYSLVGGVNDRDEDVKQLCSLIKGMNCHVNLIPVNPIKERDFVQPDHAVTLAFKNKLEKNGINATIRREMGRDIDGACGQLRKRYSEQKRESMEDRA
ncbi:MAG: 23S rRNA (adenine(2503)-C(2))-methyltransferase RlmN [Roseburia sp.]|nr:23S rRNA (adenine(2503)-C(2))-methyltransferase RlmN [Roseburia sp.]